MNVFLLGGRGVVSFGDGDVEVTILIQDATTVRHEATPNANRDIPLVATLESILAEMMEAALAGDLAKANALHYRMYDLMKLMFCNPNPVPAKKAAELMGRIQSGLPRLPLAPIDTASLEKLKAAMVALDLI